MYLYKKINDIKFAFKIDLHGKRAYILRSITFFMHILDFCMYEKNIIFEFIVKIRHLNEDICL